MIDIKLTLNDIEVDTLIQALTCYYDNLPCLTKHRVELKQTRVLNIREHLGTLQACLDRLKFEKTYHDTSELA